MGRKIGRPTGTNPDGARMREMRLAVGWTQQHLCEASEVSVRKIQDAEAGKPTGRGTLARLEGALAAERLRLEGAVITVPGDPDDWSENDLAALVARIRSVLGTTKEVRVIKVERGSTKLTVVLTPEDARRLEAAFRDGRLKPLGVLGVQTERGRRRAAAQKWGSLASSSVSLLCSLAVFLPVWRAPYFAVGAALSVAGGLLGRRRHRLLTLAIMGLVLNLFAWGVYPGAGKRQETRLPAQEVVIMERKAGGHIPIDKSLAPKLVYLINISDYQLDTSGTESGSYQPVRSAEDFVDKALKDLDELYNGPLGFLYKPDGRDFRQFNDVRDQLLRYKEPNKKFVSNLNVTDAVLDTNYLRLAVGGKDVFSGTVFVPAVNKVYCLIDRDLNGISRVMFLPDITKPMPAP